MGNTTPKPVARRAVGKQAEKVSDIPSSDPTVRIHQPSGFINRPSLRRARSRAHALPLVNG